MLGRAKIAGETEGFVKIVAEKKYDELLGVHMIGPRATELVAEAAVALRLESTVEELIRTIHAHPTMSEAVGEAAHAVHGAAIHIVTTSDSDSGIEAWRFDARSRSCRAIPNPQLPNR